MYYSNLLYYNTWNKDIKKIIFFLSDLISVLGNILLHIGPLDLTSLFVNNVIKKKSSPGYMLIMNIKHMFNSPAYGIPAESGRLLVYRGDPFGHNNDLDGNHNNSGPSGHNINNWAYNLAVVSNTIKPIMKA